MISVQTIDYVEVHYTDEYDALTNSGGRIEQNKDNSRNVILWFRVKNLGVDTL